MIINDSDIMALGVTFKLALVTTLILLVIGTPLAWWLARSKWRFKFVVEAIIALPLVLPPTVIGFYLLVALGPTGFLGSLLEQIGGPALVFSFAGLVVGSVIYSFPFVVQPIQNAFSAIDEQTLEAASTLRATPLDRFFSIAIPIARPGFITAAVLGFAHTVGEFGVVLMIGGSIPGETKVVSIAIYDRVESLDYANAHSLAGILLVFSFVILAGVYALNRRFSLLR